MKAVIEVDVPEFQIGQEVSIYFKDTMKKTGICEKKKVGHWVYSSTTGKYNCSECNYSISDKTHYCPKCDVKMLRERFFIAVVNKGVTIGYIKGLAYPKQTYSIVKDKMDSKKYYTARYVHKDLVSLESMRKEGTHPELYNNITFEIESQLVN